MSVLTNRNYILRLLGLGVAVTWGNTCCWSPKLSNETEPK